MTTYTNVQDRTRWGSGPWDDEPDKVTWVDPATDLDCMVRRGGSGAWCGYVGIPPTHPWHGTDYSACLLDDCDDEYCYGHSPAAVIQVHGDLTFASACDDEADEASGICHVPEPGREPHVWWFGFDCLHGWDVAPGIVPPPPDAVYRDLAYVREQTESLAAQLAAHATEE